MRNIIAKFTRKHNNMYPINTYSLFGKLLAIIRPPNPNILTIKL